MWETLDDIALCFKTVSPQSCAFVLIIMVCCKRKCGEGCIVFFLFLSKLALKGFIHYMVTGFQEYF